MKGEGNDNMDMTLEEFKENKKKKMEAFRSLQNSPYDVKKKRAEMRINEFISEMDKRQKEAHVSVGGLDSIVLYIFVRSIGYKEIKGISVSGLEDKGNQKVHKALGLEILKSGKSKVEVLREDGFPVLSKETAGKIYTLQNPTEKNKTTRHAIITGECGKKGHYTKNSSMKLPKKWLELFGGYENENEGVNYKIPNFKVSDKCCEFMKEKPCRDWAEKNNSCPILGLMACEGGKREKALIENGCNYYGKTTIRSAPFATFMPWDLLELALEMDKFYHENVEIFEKAYYEQPYSKDKDGNIIPYEEIETIVPEVYGEIVKGENGKLKTTGASRSGCDICGFGIQLEERPHRFDRLRERNEKAWEFYMYNVCTDPETGEKYGWGRVLDYIGVEWKNKVETNEEYEQISLELE